MFVIFKARFRVAYNSVFIKRGGKKIKYLLKFAIVLLLSFSSVEYNIFYLYNVLSHIHG